VFFFFQAEDGIRDRNVTGVQTCALPIGRTVRDGGRRGGTVRPHDSEWRESAACAGVDSELFFPETTAGVNTARSICAPCPVKAEGVAVALGCDPVGVWAGTTRRERRAMVRDRARSVAGRQQREDVPARLNPYRGKREGRVA